MSEQVQIAQIVMRPDMVKALDAAARQPVQTAIRFWYNPSLSSKRFYGPGIMVMSRRLSVYEALAEAGGVLPTGDKHKVVVLHWNADRMLQPIPVDVAAIEKGKAADSYFLRPGDQIVVPGNRYKTFQKVMQLMPVLSFARIFTGGF